MSKTEVMENNDIEVLSVNNNLINEIKANGFELEKSKFMMFVKKLPANIYKLTVAFLATIADSLPDVVGKIPLIGYGVDLIKEYGENWVAQVASDEFFDKVLCPMFGVPVDNNNNEYLRGFWDYTHHEGKYFQISMTIKTIATFIMEHPALVLAGGAATVGLAYKLISFIAKKISKKVKYNRMNEKQKEIFMLIKNILKKARKIKKATNGKVLIKDLNITYEIVDNIKEYPQMLDRIHDILLRLNTAIENKNIDEYEKCRIELETSVFIFDREHDNMLNKNIHLVEGNDLEDKEKSK